MVRKRRNNGRSKQNRGFTRRIQCEESGVFVPRDKAFKKLNVKNFTDAPTNKHLGSLLILPYYKIPKMFSYVFFCISYAFSKKYIRSRPKKLRKTHFN